MTPDRHPFLVTGATDGIGFATALALVRSGIPVILHGRTAEKARAAASEVQRMVPGAPVRTVHGDFATLDEVRVLGRHLQNEGEPLAGVIHNAGAFFRDRGVTVDGWESTWQVNHMAPFLLHHFLAPLLAAGNRARAVWVSSKLHFKGSIPWDDMGRELRWDGSEAYNASKLANALTAFRVARNHSPSFLASFALHPGVVATKMLRDGFGIDGIEPEAGARTSMFAAVNPSLTRKTGLYLDECRVSEASAAARDEALQDRLWDWTMGALGL